MFPRFFVPFLLQADTAFDLPDAVLRHVQVLRLKVGDALTLFDGTGGEYPARLETLDKRVAIVRTGLHLAREVETPYRLTLVQGVAGGDKMDWLIEKAIELGVAVIQPIQAERSVVRLSGVRAERRLAHWQGLVVAASEQCGRNRLAEVRPVLSLPEWLASPHGAAARQEMLLLTPRAQQGLCAALGHASRALHLLVGPEGGWSEREENLLLEAGCPAARLGARVLRTETAGLAALAALHACWGDF